MASRSAMLKGNHPRLGVLFAAVDPAARYVQPKVSELRFAALLTPFRTPDDAEVALLEAGAVLQQGGAK